MLTCFPVHALITLCILRHNIFIKKKPWKIQSIISFILQMKEVESEKFRDYQSSPNLVGTELEEHDTKQALSSYEALLKTLAS